MCILSGRSYSLYWAAVAREARVYRNVCSRPQLITNHRIDSHPSLSLFFFFFLFFSFYYSLYFIPYPLLLMFSIFIQSYESLGGLSIFLDPRITLPGLQYPKNGLVCSRTYQGQYTSLIYAPSLRESEITYSTHYLGQ